MIFDFIFGNPPFQDTENRKKTQHKLWIEFTTKWFSDFLTEEGELIWISPSSWGSPSNKVLNLFKENDVLQLSLDIENHFPGIGSTFSFYHIKKSNNNITTVIKNSENQFALDVGTSIKYFPNDFCGESISIHQKVMFQPPRKVSLNYDYVTCHNVIRHKRKLTLKKITSIEKQLEESVSEKVRQRREKSLLLWRERLHNCDITLSERPSPDHIYPVFHTNNKIWFSSIKQSFADKKKVMWSRSGYTKPFYDDGRYGCTDMGYYILVNNEVEGKRLEAFLKSKLMSYIFKTAKWSGFGNEIVFSSIPHIDLTVDMSDTDYYALFSLTAQEVEYLENYSPRKAKKKETPKSEIRTSQRVKKLGEVFTPVELVREMLDCVAPRHWSDKDKTFIDPACGNGNFIIEIIKKRVAHGIAPIDALSTVYGIDIMEDNVAECKRRILDLASPWAVDISMLHGIVNRNIKCADGLGSQPSEWSSPCVTLPQSFNKKGPQHLACSHQRRN